MTWLSRADSIRAVILDIDGVMTDGGLDYGSGTVCKRFHVRDGHAIKMAMRAGLKVGVLSGRADTANRDRVADLGMTFAYLGETRKCEALERLCAEQQVTPEECLFMGDDVVDIPVMRRVAVGVCVADAPEAIKRYADWQTTLAGGQGAVHEVLVALLEAQGRWAGLMERYLV